MTPCDTRSVIRTSRANIRLVDPETKGLTKTTPSGLPLSPGLLRNPGFLRNPEGCRPDRCSTFEGGARSDAAASLPHGRQCLVTPFGSLYIETVPYPLWRNS